MPSTNLSIRRRLRILCAEDHAMVAAVMVRLLVSVGHEVEGAPDGQAAWERVSVDPACFDLLITDHQMPRMDGLALVRRLRATGFRGRIIVHSNALHDAEAEEYRALRVDGIVTKATGADNLLAAVEAIGARCPGNAGATIVAK